MVKALACVLTLVFAVLPTSSGEEQERSLEKQVRELLRKSGRVEKPIRMQARLDLDGLRQKSYLQLFELRQKTEDPFLKKQLSWLLGIPMIKSARLILFGKIKKIEHIQGGVIDYHKLLLHFEGAKELKRSAVKTERLGQDQVFSLASGTHLDTWLCELMKRDLERIDGEHVFLLNRRQLAYEIGSGIDTAFVHFEYEILPKAASTIIPSVLAEKE